MSEINSSKDRVTVDLAPPFKHGQVMATHVRHILGGNPIIIIEANTAVGYEADEVCLDMAEARAFARMARAGIRHSRAARRVLVPPNHPVLPAAPLAV